MKLFELGQPQLDYKGLAGALTTIAFWYDQGQGHENQVDKIKPIISAFPFKPYVGDLFRFFPIVDKKIADSVKVGDEVEVQTGFESFQSWTTSPKIAEKIYKEHSDGDDSYSAGNKIVIGELLSPAKQVLNTRYLADVVSQLAKTKATNREFFFDHVQYAQQMIKQWKYQDEVSLLVPSKAKVKIIKIL